jgi:hypothetical protein
MKDIFSLPLDIWFLVVEYLPKEDLHACILVCKEMYELAHALHPRAWRKLTLKPAQPKEDNKPSPSLEEIKQCLQHPRYRCVSSLVIKGIWNKEFLRDVLECISQEPRELDLDATHYWDGGISEVLTKVGPHLRKLVLGYNLFESEPNLATDIAQNCPNLEHLEMRSPALAHGVKTQFPIPPTLPSLCPLLRTFGWVCYPSLANKFDLSPIRQMLNLQHLILANISILDNTAFYESVVNSALSLVTLELTLPHTFQTHGLASFAPLGASLRNLRLYNCSYNLRPLQLNLLPRLRSMTYYTSLRECDFETIDILTSLPLDMLEIRFQSSLRSIQLRERFVQLMSNKPYHLTTRGTLYDTFCYTISS